MRSKVLNRENNINTKGILKEEFNAEMALKKASLIKPEMSKIDKLMRAKFENDIELVECHGPVQMCVFKLVYTYKPLNYKMIMDCERAIFALYVINGEGKRKISCRSASAV